MGGGDSQEIGVRRPLLGLGLAVSTGAGLGTWFPFSAVSLLLLALALFLAALLFRARPFSNALIFALLVAAAGLDASLCAWNPSGRDLSKILRRPAEYVAFIGIVHDDPQFQEGRKAGERIWSFPVEMEGIRRMDEDEQRGSTEIAIPKWLPTFADMMTLLMCFFVLLLTFAEMDIKRYEQIAGSMSEAFGVQRRIVAESVPMGTSVIALEFSPGVPRPTPISEPYQQDDARPDFGRTDHKG